MSRTSPFHNMSRRQRIITAVSAIVLVTLSAAILASPRLQEFCCGKTPDQIALQREQARAEDLRRQLAELEAVISQPRPIPTDKILLARAVDLKRQLAEAEAKLGKGRPWVVDEAQAARAEDLARQNAILSARLSAPRYTPPPVVRADKTKRQIIAMHKVFGLYTAQSPFQYSEFNLVQDLVRRDADISGYFQSWRDPYREDAIKAAWARGDVPLLTWESMDQIGLVDAKANAKYSLPKIINGDFDRYLTQYARGIRNTGLPVIIRLDHEMNGNWYPWSEVRWDGKKLISVNGNRRGDYAKMWRHVHDIFEREGANKYVAWLWAPNRINAIPNAPNPKAYYPGDQYVDIIGMSGYYRPKDRRATFEWTYGSTLPLLREATRKKPILLAEIGATEDNNRKRFWMNDLFENLAKPQNRDVMGFVWFNFSVTSTLNGVINTNDWRINSSPKSYRAMSENLWKYGYGTARGPRPRFTAATPAATKKVMPPATTPVQRTTSTSSTTPSMTPSTTSSTATVPPLLTQPTTRPTSLAPPVTTRAG